MLTFSVRFADLTSFSIFLASSNSLLENSLWRGVERVSSDGGTIGAAHSEQAASCGGPAHSRRPAGGGLALAQRNQAVTGGVWRVVSELRGGDGLSWRAKHKLGGPHDESRGKASHLGSRKLQSRDRLS